MRLASIDPDACPSKERFRSWSRSHTAAMNVTDCTDRPHAGCIRTTATVSDQVEICDNDNAAAPDGQRFIQGERMGETSGATQTARAQDEFFC